MDECNTKNGNDYDGCPDDHGHDFLGPHAFTYGQCELRTELPDPI